MMTSQAPDLDILDELFFDWCAVAKEMSNAPMPVPVTTKRIIEANVNQAKGFLSYVGAETIVAVLYGNNAPPPAVLDALGSNNLPMLVLRQSQMRDFGMSW